MILIFLIVGILLVSTGIRGTEHELGARLTADITGQDGFLAWLGAIFLVSGIGLIPGFGKVRDALFILILVVILLANGKFFSNLVSAITTTEAQGPAASVAPASSGSTSSTSSGSSDSNPLGALGGIGSAIGSIFSFF
jgi:hypothetical protein